MEPLAWSDLEDLLAQLGDALEKPASLVVIGSAVCMSLGQPERMTMDVDVWKRSSDYDLKDLKQACKKIGLLFNPVDVDDPESAYLQLVEPGIVQLGRFDKTESVFKTGNLRISRPPAENIIASKLVRGEARDYDDCAYLIATTRTPLQKIRQAIDSIEDEFARESAQENLVVLESCYGVEQLKQVDRDKGEYHGIVVESDAGQVVQNVGRGRTVKHATNDLDMVPPEGKYAEIAYHGGRGVVHVVDKMRTLERGR
jgi:hypothetical protein